VSNSERPDGRSVLGDLVVEAFGFGGDVVLPALGGVRFESSPPSYVPGGGVAVPPPGGVRSRALGVGQPGAGTCKVSGGPAGLGV
jgi:hypothetical protein